MEEVLSYVLLKAHRSRVIFCSILSNCDGKIPHKATQEGRTCLSWQFERVVHRGVGGLALTAGHIVSTGVSEAGEYYYFIYGLLSAQSGTPAAHNQGRSSHLGMCFAVIQNPAKWVLKINHRKDWLLLTLQLKCQPSRILPFIAWVSCIPTQRDGSL